MKIAPRPPSLPSVSVETAKTPAAPAPIPVPYPNVQGSTFNAGGDERRYSVRFLNGIGPRLAMAGLSGPKVDELTRRFGTMNRSGLDREGRVVDAILSSTHPKEGMALYDFLARLGSAVTKGGFKVEPNAEKTWTVTPPGGDPFVFGAGDEKRRTLPDGTALELGKSGLLSVGDQVLSRDTAERVAKISAQVVLTTLCVVATAVTFGAAAPLLVAVTARGIGPLAAPLDGLLRESLGDAAKDKKDLAEKLRAYDDLSQDLRGRIGAMLTTASGLTALLSAGPAQGKALQALLDRAGRSAAPSRTNDPDVERATLLTAMGANVERLLSPASRDAAMGELTALADGLRGAGQGEARAHLGRLLKNAAADGKLTAGERENVQRAQGNLDRLGGELGRLKQQDAKADARAPRFPFKP